MRKFVPVPGTVESRMCVMSVIQVSNLVLLSFYTNTFQQKASISWIQKKNGDRLKFTQYVIRHILKTKFKDVVWVRTCAS